MELLFYLLYVSLFPVVFGFCKYDEDEFRQKTEDNAKREFVPQRYHSSLAGTRHNVKKNNENENQLPVVVPVHDGSSEINQGSHTRSNISKSKASRLLTFYKPIIPSEVPHTRLVIQPYYVTYPPNQMSSEQLDTGYIPIGPVSEVAPEYYIAKKVHRHGNRNHVHYHVHHLHGHTTHFYRDYYSNRTLNESVNHYVETVHPCENGGIVIPSSHGGSQCVCKYQYLGRRCEELNYCSSCPCGKNGRCNPVDYYPGYTCTCKKEYFGKNCEKRNPCEPNKCQHEGSCAHDGKGNMTCVCKTGYRGTFCEEINSCYPSPCKNGGTCSHVSGKVGKFMCSCPIEFKGSLCQYPTFCPARPCKNGGTCRETNDDFDCICSLPFIGKTCGERPCEPNPCFYGSTCVENGTDYHCICTPWTKGKNCSDLSVCRLNPCRTNGQCVDSKSGFRWGIKQMQYYCLCKPPYVGPHCTDNICNHCSPNGYCNNESRCVCDDGYFGNGFICETVEPDPCHPNPCKNGGICEKENGGYNCKCKPPYLPPLCMTVDPCVPDPCVNGRCITKADDSWYCKCLPEYHGAHCNKTSPCLPNPCQNNGQCAVINETKAECKCLGRWRGKVCKECDCPQSPTPNETPGTYCDAAGDCACLKFGPWLWEFNKADGICKNETKGSNDNANFCIPNPCHNSGICHLLPKPTSAPRPTIETTMKTMMETTTTPLATTTTTKATTTGRVTTLAKKSNRRRRALPDNTTTAAESHFYCECSKWFYGATCNNSKHCIPTNPCHNGGACVDKDGNFTCICPQNTTGRLCDAIPIKPTPSPDGPCHLNPCKNDGVCHELKAGYDCHCKERFTGSDCGIDRCKNCDPNAVCLHGHCVCIVGYVGNGYECLEEDITPLCEKCPAHSVCWENRCACQPGYIYLHRLCIPISTEDDSAEKPTEILPTHRQKTTPKHTTSKPTFHPIVRKTTPVPPISTFPPTKGATTSVSTTTTVAPQKVDTPPPIKPTSKQTSPSPSGTQGSTVVGPPGTLATKPAPSKRPTGPPGSFTSASSSKNSPTPAMVLGPPADVRSFNKELSSDDEKKMRLAKRFPHLKLPKHEERNQKKTIKQVESHRLKAHVNQSPHRKQYRPIKYHMSNSKHSNGLKSLKSKI